MNKILVVEDDSRLNSAVCNYLNQHGYESVGVINALEAYDVMYRSKFDLIISDIMMPEIDGFEFAETVRQSDRNIPILFMTARDDMPSKSKGYLAGIDDYMVKPVNFEEPLLHLGALLRRRGIRNNRVLTIGSFVMNSDEMTVTINGEDVLCCIGQLSRRCSVYFQPRISARDTKNR